MYQSHGSYGLFDGTVVSKSCAAESDAMLSSWAVERHGVVKDFDGLDAVLLVVLVVALNSRFLPLDHGKKHEKWRCSALKIWLITKQNPKNEGFGGPMVVSNLTSCVESHSLIKAALFAAGIGEVSGRSISSTTSLINSHLQQQKAAFRSSSLQMKQCSVHPGWLFDIGDEILPSYMGIIISQYKDPVFNQLSRMECHKGLVHAAQIWTIPTLKTIAGYEGRSLKETLEDIHL